MHSRAQSPCVRRSAGQTAISLHLLWAADLSVSHPSILAKAHLYQHRAQSHVQQQADTTPASSLSPKTKGGQQQKTRAEKAVLKQAHQQQQQQALHAAFTLPQLISCLLQTYWFWGAPLTLSWILEVSVAGLGHSAPTLMDLDPQQPKSVAQAHCYPHQQPL